MSDTKFLIVVYQFGKVASTALVNSLNTCKEIEAHQSHFLGEDALQRMIPNIVDTKIGPYFRKHMTGQLVNNLELTHLVNTCLKGKSDRKLIVISLSREPIDWFRSCVQQDIEGYCDDILQYASQPGEGPPLKHGLECILADLNKFLVAGGSVQHTVNAIRDNKAKELFQKNDGLPKDIARRMLLLAMRPLVWFDDHFARCFDFGLKDIPANGNHWLRQDEKCSFIVLRYEDIETEFPRAMQSVEVPYQGPICRANSSHDKPHADEIRAAFQSDAAIELRRLVLQSEYANHFGYDTGNSALSAA